MNMSEKFAKIFETEQCGQIVAIQQTRDEDSGGEIRFFFKPPKLGVCNLALGFKDSDDGWGLCDDAFDRLDEQMAVNIVKETYDRFS